MRRTVLAVTLLSLTAATRGQAQEADADTLTKHGLELRREHRDLEALEEFRRAYALQPTPRALAQIAFAEQAVGRWVNAESDLARAMQARDDPWIKRNAAVLGMGLASIQAHLGWLEVTTDVTSAELWVNGVRAGDLPLRAPLRVEAGSLTIEVRASGFAPAQRSSSVEPGGSAREFVHLVPVAPAPLAPPSPAPLVVPSAVSPSRSGEHVVPTNKALRAGAFVALGASAGAIALGAYFGVRTLSTKSDRDGHCTGPGQTCDRTGLALDAEARSLATRSTAWLAFGLVSAGSGAVLLWVSRSRTLPDRAEGIRLSPLVGPDRAGAVLGGSW